LSTSDLPALLYLKYLLKPPLPHEKIQYLVVDEAQDCSPAQLFILRKYTESGRMMIVGDLMQGIINPDGVSNWDDMIGTIFPQKDTRFFNIRTSYRTTKEIIEFVNSRMRRWHVPSNLLPLPVLRRGIEPHVHHEYDIDEMLMHMGQVIGNMKESGYHNIAVIVPEQFLPLFSAQLDRQYPDMTAVVSTEDTYEGGILISHIKLLKGLEFDAVVYVNYPNEDPGNSMQEIKSFYTSCTRAMHELRIFEYE
ncbi:MAG: UvrD-helicase domain-containing protein, partial [Candidatus Dojkabacteria bacterium]|nr:UvrD-helicase domain-containing protein [Candidatus Dojkabacteria bacterium]